MAPAGPIALNEVDLLWTLGLLAFTVALATWQRLGLSGQMLWAGFRAIVQLLVVGASLTLVFTLDNPWAVALVLAVMSVIAAVVARNRMQIPGQKGLWIWGAITFSAALTLVYSLGLIIQPPVWYSPQYLIPLAGMVLGNAMNSATLAGERLGSLIRQSTQEIETYLSLGASLSQAIFAYRQAALRASLTPILNQMLVVGLVSLPGMFTGQVLAGSDPLNAASYQILILFMILLADLLSALLVCQGIQRRFFNGAWQLLADR
jgi:putative ABC transport system permease protein